MVGKYIYPARNTYMRDSVLRTKSVKYYRERSLYPNPHMLDGWKSQIFFSRPVAPWAADSLEIPAYLGPGTQVSCTRVHTLYEITISNYVVVLLL